MNTAHFIVLLLFLSTNGVSHTNASIGSCLENVLVDLPFGAFGEDPYKLMDLYEQLSAKANVSTQCSDMLLRMVREALLGTVNAVLVDALMLETFHNDTKLQQLSQRIYRSDPHLSQALYVRLIDTVYPVSQKPALVNILAANENFQQKAFALLHLHRKLITRADYVPQLLEQMMQHLAIIGKNPEFSDLPTLVQQSVVGAYRTLRRNNQSASGTPEKDLEASCDEKSFLETFIDSIYGLVEKKEDLLSMLHENENYEQMVHTMVHLQKLAHGSGNRDDAFWKELTQYYGDIRQHKDWEQLPQELKKMVLNGINEIEN